MRVHLIAPPNVQTTREFELDGFNICTIRFARLLKERLGAHVTLYASEENEAPCDELVQCISREEQARLLAGVPYQYAAMEMCLGLWQLANPRAAEAIEQRKRPRDLVCIISGLSQKWIADQHPDLMTVEYSVGYVGSWSPYRVFESHAWRSATYGLQRTHEDVRFYDAVIPMFYPPEEFPYNPAKEPFALYVGRIVQRKGIAIACQAARTAGLPLKVIGHGDPSILTDGAEYLGALPSAERNEWMSRAQVLLCPTTYLEPFGSVAAEAQLCGTPVVSTDHGGFTETVEHGRTGFRCSYLGEFARAIKACAGLDPLYIHNRAKALYSIKAVAPQYSAYFARLDTLWDKGWETLDG